MDGGVALVCEYMTNLGLTRQCILNGDLFALREHLIQADPAESSVFLNSFVNLVVSGRISEEVALLSVANPSELRRRLRGISSTLS
jgi:Tfp pilus assembly ATPase PilU